MYKNNNYIHGVTRAVLFCGLLWSSSAFSALIQYSVTNIGGNSWQYAYTVNNELVFDIDEFSIFFEPNLYQNLVLAGSPADWDSIVIQPDTVIPADGLFDSLALVAGLVPGDSVADFVVNFDWLGAGSPGSQAFEIVDPFTFGVLADGVTMLLDVGGPPPSPLPVPGTLGLLLMGLLATARYSRRIVPINRSKNGCERGVSRMNSTVNIPKAPSRISGVH